MRDVIIPIGGTRPPKPNNQCNLCKRTMPPSSLTRCPRCKQLFCKSCITEDLREGEYLICLNCARRYVAPKTSAFKNKYMPLTLYLSQKAKWTKWLKLQFIQIEGLIGADLPASAQKSVKWWANPNTVHSEAWQSIGWSIKEVDLKEKTVIFTRPNIVESEKENKKAPVMALPKYKPIKKKTPSLTRIAIAQARLQNISNKKSAPKTYRGKFHPKTAYEKRLWKTDKKP